MNDVLERPAADTAPDSGTAARTVGHAGARWRARVGGGRRRVVAAVVVLAVVLIVVVALAVGGRSGGSGTASSPGATSEAVAPQPAVPGASSGSASSGSGSSGGSSSGGSASGADKSFAAPGGAASEPAPDTAAGTTPTQPKTAPRVVQTGSLDLVVGRQRFDASFSKLQALATGLGGFVATRETSFAAEHPTGSITLRVPSASFDKLVDGVRGLGTVTSSNTTSRDVTGDYVDLQARISALTATRATYLTLLSKASTIGDTLAVQQNITAVQTQIEQLEGQRQVLADQSDLATLAVQVTEQGSPVATTGPQSPPTGFSGAAHRAWHRFSHGLESIVAATGTIALILVVGAVLVGLAVAGRALLRRRAGTPPAAGSDAG